MNDLGRCEYCQKRGQKLLRCTLKVRQTADIEGETLNLCIEHATLVMRLLARKAKVQKYYDEVSQQIALESQRIIDAWHEAQASQHGSPE